MPSWPRALAGKHLGLQMSPLSVTISVPAAATWEMCFIAADAIRSLATGKLGYNPQTRGCFPTDSQNGRMKIRGTVYGIAAVVVTALTTMIALHANAYERAKADIDCQPTDDKLVYDCTIKLTRRKGDQPIDGAEITIFADMPSMPMAHNVPPVMAEAAREAGVYRAQLRLEMQGEWALRLRISGPLAQRIFLGRYNWSNG